MNSMWIVVERGLERDDEQAAEKARLDDSGPLEEGRRQVEGEIISHKWTEDRGYGSQHKMLVKLDDGNKIWGSVPRAIEDAARTQIADNEDGTWEEIPPQIDELKGVRVRFTATIERSRDDEHFGFFKRPTKPEVIA